MTDYGAGAPSDFARSTRMPLDAVVRLHFEGTVAFQNGFAANVSATGMFVKHPEPPPIGTRLVFEFTVGSARKPVQGTGEVVWIRDKYDGPGRPAGGRTTRSPGEPEDADRRAEPRPGRARSPFSAAEEGSRRSSDASCSAA